MEPEISSPHLQVPATCPYPEREHRISYSPFFQTKMWVAQLNGFEYIMMKEMKIMCKKKSWTSWRYYPSPSPQGLRKTSVKTAGFRDVFQP